MRQILRSVAYGMTRKRINEQQLEPLHIHIDHRDISCFNLSTNAILSFYQDGELCYFRECPKLCSRSAFMQNAVEVFWRRLHRLGINPEHFKQALPIKLEFSDATVKSFSAYLTSKMTDRHFINTLSKTDRIAQSCRFSVWEPQIYDRAFFKRFGMEDIPEGMDDIAVYFLWCMRSAAAGYRTLNLVRGKEYSYFNAVRAVSSRIVAEALGLEHMITDARFCVLHTEDGASIRGFLSHAAPGSRMVDSTVAPTGSLQQALGNLQILDLISYQVDHGPNNYNVFLDGEGRASVCAFDNDNPTTFFPIPIISRPFVGCSSFVDGKGRVQRPFVDKTLADRMAALSVSDLDQRLKPYLNLLQRRALISRIKKLNRVIQRSLRDGNHFLLTPEEWNDATVQQELSGRYGVTYLSKALRSTATSE